MTNHISTIQSKPHVTLGEINNSPNSNNSRAERLAEFKVSFKSFQLRDSVNRQVESNPAQSTRFQSKGRRDHFLETGTNAPGQSSSNPVHNARSIC